MSNAAAVAGADYTAAQLTQAAAASVAALKADGDAKQPAAAATVAAGAGDAKIARSDHIYLVGDSVLDNFIWLSNPKTKNLTAQLRDAVAAADAKAGAVDNIHCFAVDESVSADVLRGKTPGFQYVKGRKEFGLEPYPVDSADGKVYPLNLITAHATSKAMQSAGARGLAVVSVGGNDARIQLTHFQSGGGAAVLKAMETPGKYTANGLTQNLHDIVQHLNGVRAATGAAVYPVLVLCYLPHKSFLPPHRNDLKTLAAHVANTVLFPLAAKHALPVIDLSRTFDPDNGAHYGQGKGSSPIEPSDLSTAFIVRLIAAVCADFKFGTDQSKVYFGADKITIERNPAVAAVAAAPGAAAVGAAPAGAGAAAKPPAAL